MEEQSATSSHYGVDLCYGQQNDQRRAENSAPPYNIRTIITNIINFLPGYKTDSSPHALPQPPSFHEGMDKILLLKAVELPGLLKKLMKDQFITLSTTDSSPDVLPQPPSFHEGMDEILLLKAVERPGLLVKLMEDRFSTLSTDDEKQEAYFAVLAYFLGKFRMNSNPGTHQILRQDNKQDQFLPNGKFALFNSLVERLPRLGNIEMRDLAFYDLLELTVDLGPYQSQGLTLLGAQIWCLSAEIQQEKFEHIIQALKRISKIQKQSREVLDANLILKNISEIQNQFQKVSDVDLIFFANFDSKARQEFFEYITKIQKEWPESISRELIDLAKLDTVEGTQARFGATKELFEWSLAIKKLEPNINICGMVKLYKSSGVEGMKGLKELLEWGVGIREELKLEVDIWWLLELRDQKGPARVKEFLEWGPKIRKQRPTIDITRLMKAAEGDKGALKTLFNECYNNRRLEESLNRNSSCTIL